jgi:hypothetical protein
VNGHLHGDDGGGVFVGDPAIADLNPGRAARGRDRSGVARTGRVARASCARAARIRRVWLGALGRRRGSCERGRDGVREVLDVGPAGASRRVAARCSRGSGSQPPREPHDHAVARKWLATGERGSEVGLPTDRARELLEKSTRIEVADPARPAHREQRRRHLRERHAVLLDVGLDQPAGSPEPRRATEDDDVVVLRRWHHPRARITDLDRKPVAVKPSREGVCDREHVSMRGRAQEQDASAMIRASGQQPVPPRAIAIVRCSRDDRPPGDAIEVGGGRASLRLEPRELLIRGPRPRLCLLGRARLLRTHSLHS